MTFGKISNFVCRHQVKFLTALVFLLLFAGLWPFNFTPSNEILVSPGDGLKISRHGTAYTPGAVDKLHGLSQFTLYLDVVSSSDGLSSFEKILSHAVNQENANFIVGQWKDGLGLHLKADGRSQEIHFGGYGVLRMNDGIRGAISFNGRELNLHVNGKSRATSRLGPLAFRDWDSSYPLVLGTDATGGSQWKGIIHEIAIFDRALTAEEVAKWQSGKEANSHQPSADSRQLQGKRQENPPLSPFVKGGKSSAEPVVKGGSGKGEIDAGLRPLAMTEKGAGGAIRRAQDGRPLIHYVFRPENTYETSFRGQKAAGVRDLGKGEPADLVIPDYFMPYRRTFLERPFANRRSLWQDKWDILVNFFGFIPFGLLVFMALANGCRGIGNREKQESGNGERREAVGKIGLATIVFLTVAAGFAVSVAIEWVQAYLPSRHSSMMDVMCNTLGTTAGVCAALLLQKKSSMREIPLDSPGAKGEA